ncbi:hypothetical protein MKW98_003757 [Papaver atlanticum]|uniref:Uncharacterized protein n=1 Tax=Papaver atlanticum TaxID=357466 RepID=A0AAD4T858_9MAGN|nr:hypothetical protein MKW98_003757 [Papaver atlanticum]
MKMSTNVNLVRFLSVLSLSSLLFQTVSAQENSTVTGKTNSADVVAIKLLVDTFFIKASAGDPCLPTPFSWVKCSSGDTPRVTELNLTQKVSGSHLPDFSAMDALEKIDLSLNIFLTIEFPDFLANFPKLKVLNLAAVPWSGTVPTSLLERSENKTLNLTLSSWGTNLCYSDEDVCPKETNGGTPILRFNPPVHKKNTVSIVLGILIPVLMFWAIITGFIAYKRKRKAATAAAGLSTPNLNPSIFSVQGK